MRRIGGPAILLLCFAAVGWAQPQIGAVTNAADYTLTLSPGGIATIFGTGLAPSEASASGIPLQTTLNNVSVSVSGRPAPLFYVSATQINFQIPYKTTAGVASLSVTNGSQKSNSVQAVVAPYSPGIFQYGAGHGVIQNQDLSLNSAANPAAGGSFITVYLTGIGPTSATVADGAEAPSSPLASFTGTATATIGDSDAPVQFLGLTPGLVGLAQANIQVPALPTGDYPLVVSMNGYQNVSALVSVSGSGGGFQVSSLLSLVGSIALPGVGPTQVPGISGIVDNSVALLGNTLYVCSPLDIKVVDVSNPAAPKSVNKITDSSLASSGHNCTVNSAGAKPFLTDLIRATQSFAVYDLSNPATPTRTALKALPFLARSIAYSGNTAFMGQYTFTPSGHNVVGTFGNIMSVDLSNISKPVLGALMKSNPAHPETNTTNMRPDMIVRAPNLLYVASTTASENFNSGTGALDVFDVTNPSSIQGAGQILVPGSRMLINLTAAGTELLAVGDTTGFGPGNTLPNGGFDFPFTGNLTLAMFDITDPTKPKLQGNVIVNSMRPGDCGGPVSLGTVPIGGGFFAISCDAPDLNATGGSGNGSLVIVDARDPRNPQAYTYGTLPGLGGLTVANGYLYAAVGSGANIYKIQLP